MLADFLIIGGLGDLAFRKLYPAFYYLDRSGHLPESLRIVVVARKEISRDHFLKEVHKGLKKYSIHEINKSEWQKFFERFFYYAGDAVDAARLSEVYQQAFTDPNRNVIIYFATPSNIILPVCQALQQTGKIGASVKFVLEKPLGNDLSSFSAVLFHSARLNSLHRIPSTAAATTHPSSLAKVMLPKVV